MNWCVVCGPCDLVCFSNFNMCQNCQVGLLKHNLPVPNPIVWYNKSQAGLSIWISKRLLNGADADGFWSHFANDSLGWWWKAECWRLGIFPINQSVSLPSKLWSIKWNGHGWAYLTALSCILDTMNWKYLENSELFYLLCYLNTFQFSID